MSAGIFEELSRSLINLDEQRYVTVLSQTEIPLPELITLEKNNSKKNIVIHELSLSIAREEHLIGFFSQICTLVAYIELKNNQEIFKILLNQRNNDGKTPLHLAIMTGRKVKDI